MVVFERANRDRCRGLLRRGSSLTSFLRSLSFVLPTRLPATLTVDLYLLFSLSFPLLILCRSINSQLDPTRLRFAARSDPPKTVRLNPPLVQAQLASLSADPFIVTFP